MNGHQAIVKRIKDVIDSQLRADPAMDFDMQVEASIYPILACSILVTPTDTTQLSSNDLPALYYRYAVGGNNPAISGGTQFEGETLVFSVNVTFEKYSQDEHLIDTAARWHDAFASIASRLNTPIVDSDTGATIASIREVHLSGVADTQLALSEREHLLFAIEINWTYPVDIM